MDTKPNWQVAYHGKINDYIAFEVSEGNDVMERDDEWIRHYFYLNEVPMFISSQVHANEKALGEWLIQGRKLSEVWKAAYGQDCAPPKLEYKKIELSAPAESVNTESSSKASPANSLQESYRNPSNNPNSFATWAYTHSFNQ